MNLPKNEYFNTEIISLSEPGEFLIPTKTYKVKDLNKKTLVFEMSWTLTNALGGSPQYVYFNMYVNNTNTRSLLLDTAASIGAGYHPMTHRCIHFSFYAIDENSYVCFPSSGATHVANSYHYNNYATGGTAPILLNSDDEINFSLTAQFMGDSFDITLMKVDLFDKDHSYFKLEEPVEFLGPQSSTVVPVVTMPPLDEGIEAYKDVFLDVTIAIACPFPTPNTAVLNITINNTSPVGQSSVVQLQQAYGYNTLTYKRWIIPLDPNGRMGQVPIGTLNIITPSFNGTATAVNSFPGLITYPNKPMIVLRTTSEVIATVLDVFAYLRR